MKFNLNQYVKVKLTRAGIAELRRQHEELRSRCGLAGVFKLPAEDRNGMRKFQAHTIISSLGHMLSVCGELPFNSDIILCDHSGNELVDKK
jgi:hypothetical protein